MHHYSVWYRRDRKLLCHDAAEPDLAPVASYQQLQYPNRWLGQAAWRLCTGLCQHADGVTHRNMLVGAFEAFARQRARPNYYAVSAYA